MRHIKSKISLELKDKHDISDIELMRIVLPLFLDDYKGTDAPFSLHNIIEIGKVLFNKGAGEWYGAHSISQVIRDVNEKYNQQYYKSFKVVTFNEGTYFQLIF
jgi:hypothetical protein